MDFKIIIDFFDEKDFYDLEMIVLKRIRSCLSGSKNHLLVKDNNLCLNFKDMIKPENIAYLNKQNKTL